MFDQTTVTDLPPMRYEPVTKRQLRAYASGLRRNDRTLTRAAAFALAVSHEAQRAAAYQRDNEETPMDWYCPECCASSSSGGICAGCDITLVKGDPNGGS